MAPTAASMSNEERERERERREPLLLGTALEINQAQVKFRGAGMVAEHGECIMVKNLLPLEPL